MTELADAAAAAYVRARDIRGVPITIQRLTGTAPDITTVAATVRAVIPENAAATREPGAAEDSGRSLLLDRRSFIVLAADLVAAGFPLPIRKNDRVLVAGSPYKLEVVAVDADKRAIAGAVEFTTSGAS